MMKNFTLTTRVAKSVVTAVVLLLVACTANAQSITKPETGTKNISGSEIYAVSSIYTAGSAMDLTFHYHFESADMEYGKSATLTFPSGVTVNSSDNIGNLMSGGETGDGVTINWDGGFGHQEGDVDFSVNVTVNAGFSGDLNVDWSISGDDWGSAPHTVSGTTTISEPSAEDAGIIALVNPTSSFSTGTEDVIVTLKNNGTNNLTSVNIDWSVDGVSQTTYNWTGDLATNATENVTLGSYDFSSGGTYTIISETSSPNGLTDGNTSNDQLTTDVTAIGAISLPYTQNFDAVTAPAIPTDWVAIDGDGTGSAYVKTQNFGSSYSAPNEVVMYNAFSTTVDLILVSPLMNDPSAAKLKFYASGTSKVSVGTISDPTDASTYTELEEVALTGEYVQYTVDFSSYTGTDKYMAFKHPAAEYMKYVYIDNVTIQEPAPYELSVQVLNENKVAANGEQVDYKVKISNSGLNNDTYDLSLLEAEATWNYVVRNNDDNTDITTLSLNAGNQDTVIVRATIPSGLAGNMDDALRFAVTSQADNSVTDTSDITTKAYIAYTNITEDFEGATELPDYWTYINDGESGDASIMVRNWSSDAHGGTNALRVSSSMANPELYVISPALVGNGTGYTVDFWAKGGTGREVVVGTVTDKYDLSTFVSADTLDLSFSYQEGLANVLINEPTGYIVLLPTFSSSFQSTDIDDIMISELAEYDAGINQIAAPDELVELGLQQVKVNIKNYGSQNLTSAAINWSVDDGNGELVQSAYSWTGDIALTETDENVNIGSFDFTAGGYYDIKVWTTDPNGNTDENNLNDTITKQIFVVAPITTPYTENFDGVTAPEIPAGWRGLVNSTASNACVETYSTNHSAPNSVRMYNEGDAGATLMLVSPPVETFEGNRLKFYAQGGSGMTLSIGTMSDPTDPSTYTEFKNISVPFGFAEYTVNLYEYTGTDGYIAFKHGLGGTYRTIYIDDFTWEEVPFIDPGSANFDLLAVNDTSEVQIFTITNTSASPLDIMASNISVTGTNATEFVVEPLADATLNTGDTYGINVKFVPSSEGHKNAYLTVNAGSKAEYNLPLEGYAMPENTLIEDFEGTWLPAGWTQEDPYGWEQKSAAAIDGNYSAYIGYDTYQLITPKLDIKDGDSLTFIARKSVSGGNLIIQISENGSDWTDLVDLSATLSTDAKTFKVDFTAGEAGQAYIAFKGTQYTYLDNIIGPVMIELSDDATLSDLVSGGQTVPGFAAEVNDYNIVLPSGTALVPWVSATTNHSNATADVTQAAALPGTASVLVTAENGETTNTYTINYTVAASNDSTLSELFVDDELIDGFDSDIHTYNVELPHGTQDLPVVTATATDANANVSVNNVTELPGAASIEVTAADGIAALTYTINFTVAPNNDASLTDLLVDGETVNGFDPGTLIYDVELPYGTTDVPVVTADATDSNADVVITDATSLPGTTEVMVTAENGTTQLIYEVNFTVAPNNDATLSDLQVDGETIPAFDAGTLIYDVELPYGTTDVPVVTADATDSNADVVITDATSLPGTSTVLVTAEDGITQLTYEVNFTLADPSADATLSNLEINGESIDGFDPETETYNVVLESGTTTIPVVTATCHDQKAEHVVNNATELPGAATVIVTAEDGETTKTYTVNFTVATGFDFEISQTSKVYPIPCKGEFTVDLGYNIQSEGSWKLTNMNGQVIAHGLINQSYFKVRSNSRGVFILTITVDQQILTKRIVME